MISPLDLSTLSPQAQRIVLPTAPEKAQEVAARGVLPGLRPAEILAVLLLLGKSERLAVRETATRTLGELPEPILNGALGAELHPEVIDLLARNYGRRLDVVEALLRMPTIASDTLEDFARSGSEMVTELIATNEERLVANPRLIELLYMNQRTRMSTADRVIELAVRHRLDVVGIPAWREVSSAIQNELIVESSEELTPDDLLFLETQQLSDRLRGEADEDTHTETDEGKEIVKEKFKPLYQRIAEMSVTQKIRRAMLGSKEERMMLIRDNNKLVSSAAVRSPLMDESEAALVSRNRNVSDEVLRIIGTTPEFMRSYVVKRNLVENPKTPVVLSTRLVVHLREADLRQISKSRNISTPVKEAARRQLERRNT